MAGDALTIATNDERSGDRAARDQQIAAAGGEAWQAIGAGRREWQEEDITRSGRGEDGDKSGECADHRLEDDQARAVASTCRIDRR
jgi:hypothetical protein